MNENFDLARKLIDEREVEAGNMPKAETLLKEIIQKEPKTAWAYGLLCEIQYWKGEVAEKKDKLSIYQIGSDFGKKGVEIDPNNLESNFWLGVNYGQLGEEQGIISSAFLIKPIETHFKKAFDINDKYFFGGPYRALGWFYHKIPSWPIANGDSKKGLKMMEDALKIAPDFYLNHIYAAQIALHLGDKKKAKEHVEWILNAPLTPKHEKEDTRYKAEAKEIQKKI